MNWRTHPQSQRDALRAAIEDVGYIRSVTVNKRTGRLVDGHERVWQALASEQPLIDVEYVDLSPEEELKALATMDPIGELARVDGEKLHELLKDVGPCADALKQMLEEITPPPMLDFSSPPESVLEQIANLESIKAKRKKSNEGIIAKNDTEKYLVIVFGSREQKQALLAELGLPADERYLPVGTVTIKPRGLMKAVQSISDRKPRAAPANNSGACG